MRIVYAVSSGSYSDYGVDLIFETRELAQAYCDRENSVHAYHQYRVEEFELHDSLSVREERVEASAELYLDGTLSPMRIYKQLVNPGQQVDERVYATRRIPRWEGDPFTATIIQVRHFRSEEQAQKAIYDKAAQIKAERAGIA